MFYGYYPCSCCDTSTGNLDDHLEPTEELLRRRISVLRICESRLLGTVNNPEASVEDLCKMIKSDRDHSVRLTGGVAVFCDPGTYLSEEEMHHLRSQGYAVAIGLHPERVNSYTDEDYRAFEEQSHDQKSPP